MPHSTHENHNQSISNLWLQLAKLRQITNNTDKSPCQNRKPPAVSKTNPEMPTPQNQPLSLFGLSTKNPDLSVRGERELVRPLFRQRGSRRLAPALAIEDGKIMELELHWELCLLRSTKRSG